jgi:CheY-like chemotaxis protein
MKILLVEDDLVNQKVTTQLLKKWNMQMEIAGDGNEALDKLSAQSYDLVLMDLNLPVIDGCETVRKIRNANSSYSQVPVFAYTSSSTADTTMKANALLMNDFIAKPLNPFELHCKINTHVLQPKVEARPVKLKFDFFQAEESFEKELIFLIIRNMKALEYASFQSYYTRDINPYQTATHKSKSTVLLLDDKEYLFVVEDLHAAFVRNESSESLQEKINRLSAISQSILKSLQGTPVYV